MVENEDDETNSMATPFRNAASDDDEPTYDKEVPNQGTQQADLPVQNPPPPPEVNDPMNEDSQLADLVNNIIELTKENQEGKFHTPTLGVNQVNEADGTDATIGDEDPYVGKFDLILDVVALYVDVPGSHHRVLSTGKVVKETPTDDATGQTLPPPVIDVNKRKDPKVSDIPGVAVKSSQDVATTSTHADPIIPTDGTNLVGDPIVTTADPSTMVPYPNTAAIDPVPPTDPNAIDIATESADMTIPTMDGDQRVGVSETSSTEERSNPSLG